jgi:hypothetical protein
LWNSNTSAKLDNRLTTGSYYFLRDNWVYDIATNVWTLLYDADADADILPPTSESHLC